MILSSARLIRRSSAAQRNGDEQTVPNFVRARGAAATSRKRGVNWRAVGYISVIVACSIFWTAVAMICWYLFH